jgi:hypothetical protein
VPSIAAYAASMWPEGGGYCGAGGDFDQLGHGTLAYLEQDDERRELAEKMAREGHAALRELAAAIARTGLGREQEAMHHLISELPAALSHIS